MTLQERRNKYELFLAADLAIITALLAITYFYLETGYDYGRLQLVYENVKNSEELIKLASACYNIYINSGIFNGSLIFLVTIPTIVIGRYFAKENNIRT